MRADAAREFSRLRNHWWDVRARLSPALSREVTGKCRQLPPGHSESRAAEL